MLNEEMKGGNRLKEIKRHLYIFPKQDNTGLSKNLYFLVKVTMSELEVFGLRSVWKYPNVRKHFALDSSNKLGEIIQPEKLFEKIWKSISLFSAWIGQNQRCLVHFSYNFFQSLKVWIVSKIAEKSKMKNILAGFNLDSTFFN